jgi:hypothetical protein
MSSAAHGSLLLASSSGARSASTTAFDDIAERDGLAAADQVGAQPAESLERCRIPAPEMDLFLNPCRRSARDCDLIQTLLVRFGSTPQSLPALRPHLARVSWQKWV